MGWGQASYDSMALFRCGTCQGELGLLLALNPNDAPGAPPQRRQLFLMRAEVVAW